MNHNALKGILNQKKTSKQFCTFKFILVLLKITSSVRTKIAIYEMAVSQYIFCVL